MALPKGRNGAKSAENVNCSDLISCGRLTEICEMAMAYL
jgi:hypothetical protein